MKKGIRKILAVTFGILGTALAIYVGGYLLLFRPMRHLLVGFAAGALTRSDLIISVIKYFLPRRRPARSGVCLTLLPESSGTAERTQRKSE